MGIKRKRDEKGRGQIDEMDKTTNVCGKEGMRMASSATGILTTLTFLQGWRRSVVVSGVDLINEVNRH